MRYFAFAALVFFTFVPAVAPAQTQDAASLLALHRHYVGWQFGDGTFTTLRLTGHSTDASGTVVTAWRTLEMGAAYRNDYTSRRGLTASEGFTGRIFWDSDENGFTHPDYSPAQAFNISHYVLFNGGTSELTGTLQSPQTVNGIACDVVRVQPPSGDSIDLYVDPSTGAYVRAVIDPAGSYETTYDILDYSEVAPGKRYIHRYHIDGAASTYEITKIDANAPVTPADLHPPSPTATWNFANPNAFPIAVKPHAIYVDAAINGVLGHFVLDTGASGIYLSSAFAQRAHLHTITSGSASGIGADILRTSIQRADTFTIGGNTLSNVVIASGRYDATDQEAPGDVERPDGLIGYTLFGGAIIFLNVSTQTMRIADPSTTTVDASSGAVIRVDLSTETPVVPMVIDGRATANATLDMGDGSTVVMSPELIRKRHIPLMAHELQGGSAFYDPSDPNDLQDYVNSHVVVEGVGGSEVESCATVASIALGPIVYQSTYACSSPEVTGDDIIVGFDFLRNFDFVFDYHDGIIILKPHR